MPRMSALRRAALLAMLLCLTASAWTAEPTPPPLTREEAVSALRTGESATRQLAAMRLERLGTMADVPALLSALHDPDNLVRSLAQNAVWAVWGRSGDERIDALMENGRRQMAEGRLTESIETFSRVVGLAPDYAEGWNKRATAWFLVGNLDASARDCDQVLARNPSHFGALAGYGMIETGRGNMERALAFYEQALDINPNLTGVRASIGDLRRAIARRARGQT
jgi:tetratricopeptide (TPR) repeat protein